MLIDACGTGPGMPSLTFDGNYFILRSSSSESLAADARGFRWSDGMKAWFTSDPKVAVGYRQYAEGQALTKLDRMFLSPIPWQWALPKIPEGLQPFEIQKEAARFALENNRTYLALDPGLGKTIAAILIAASVKNLVVYITSPSLLQDVEEKFINWAPQLKLFINKKGKAFPPGIDVMIIPDSIISRPGIFQELQAWLSQSSHATVIVDEAQRYTNPDSKRTKALLGYLPAASRPQAGIVDLFYRQVYMSGTPIRNRPMELYPILAKAAPECIDFMNRFEYGKKYCGGHRTHFGWDFSGSSNMKELEKRIKLPDGPFMLRMRKEDAIDLPPKIEEIFVISDDMGPRITKLDKQLLDEYGAEDLIKHRIKVKLGEENEDIHVATYRRLLGEEKVKHAAEYIKTIMDESSENIIVFAFHTEVINQLQEQLKAYKPLVITGEVPPDKRFDIVKQFQNADFGRRIIIGNYIAMGIGFTLTKATRSIFVEFSWVPGENEQASDRMHRIGQTKTVYSQFMVYKNSMDKKVIEAILQKRAVLKHI